jgi:hypothetical protein
MAWRPATIGSLTCRKEIERVTQSCLMRLAIRQPAAPIATGVFCMAVAPRVGAWIETAHPYNSDMYQCRPPRGGVD